MHEHTSNSTRGQASNASDTARAQRLNELLERLLQEYANDDSLDEQSIIDAHTELMPELGERLRAMRLILDAGRTTGDTNSTVEVDSPTGKELPLPDNIPGFKILRRIHSGGQGVVYLGIQISTKRKAAVKVLLAGVHTSRAAHKRFEREVELAAQLKHPHIISIFESGRTLDGLPFYAMDYVSGLPLHRYVHDNDLTLEDTLRLFGDVCDAVQYAHQKGVIHRDLKPNNILVDAEGDPKILDFGLAKLLSEPLETVVSLTQDVIGTVPYMSPEQVRGTTDQIDTRTDVYALGVILYELLTGHFPYPVVGQLAEVFQHIARTEPTPPSRQWTKDSGITRRSNKSLRVGRCPIDNELQTVVLKTLSKERQRRYQSAGELGRDIRHYLADEPIEAKRDSGWYVLRKAWRRHKVPIVTGSMFIILGFVLGVRLTLSYKSALEKKQEQLALTAQQLNDALMQRSDDLVELGWTLEQVYKRRDEAYSKYETALRINPSNFRALCYAANWKQDTYFTQSYNKREPRLLTEANELCDKALAINDHSHQLWNLKGQILYTLGNLPEAEAAFRRTLDLRADFSYAESNLAIVLALQKRLDAAIDHAEKGAAISERQQAESEQDDFVWRTLAALQIQLQRGEPLSLLKKAKRIDRADVRNQLLLARLYLTLGDTQHSESALNEVQEADEFDTTNDPRIKRVLAMAHLANHQYADASLHAGAAVQRGDLPSYGHAIRAIAEAELGNYSTAKEQLELARKHRPSQLSDGDYVVIAENGLLWFDTRTELDALLERAAATVASAQ